MGSSLPLPIDYDSYVKIQASLRQIRPVGLTLGLALHKSISLMVGGKHLASSKKSLRGYVRYLHYHALLCRCESPLTPLNFCIMHPYIILHHPTFALFTRIHGE